MELTILNNREIKPYKVAVKQFESETTTLTFTRDSYMYDQVDLRNYKAYAVTSIGGAVDMTELTYEIVDGKLVITWVVQEYTLRQAGNITYQIVFKENADDGEGTAVFYTYEALLQCSESIDTDRPIAANYPTIMKQWLDLINNMAGTISTGIVYMGVGETIPVANRLAGRLYYQIKDEATLDGHFEDNLGNKIGTFTGEYQADADINKMIAHGDYICAGTLLNAPIDCTYCMVRVTDTLSTDRVIQEVYVPADDNTLRVFTRAITGYDTFGAWCELVKKGAITANMALVSDANGNVVSHANVSSTELNALNGYVVGGGTVESRLSKLEGGLTGEIKWFAGSAVPEGYLLCDGSKVSRTTYAKLFAAIGTTWGTGDGSTTFTLPNLINRVAWGGSTSGAYKDAGLPNITGDSGTIYAGNGAASGAFTRSTTPTGRSVSLNSSDQGWLSLIFNASNANAIYGKSSTVQPPAATLMPIIKY